MRRFGYLVVEGPHDVEYCCRFLRESGLVKVEKKNVLDKFFWALIPATFPHNGDLIRRVPVPTFMQNDDLCVAVDSAGGETELVSTLQETFHELNYRSFFGVGLMLDSDSTIPAQQRYSSLRDALIAKDILVLPNKPGCSEVNEKVRRGAFVLPNNSDLGTLEDLLLDGAEVQYKSLLDCAKKYVEEAATAIESLDRGHRKYFNKDAGQKKAVISAMSSIFRPGKAVQVSIHDNDWVRGAAMRHPRISEVQRFLTELFDLPQPTT